VIDQRTTEPWMAWAGTQAEQESAAQGRAGKIAGGRVGSPMCSRIARPEGVSMTKAMIFMSAPQYRQVSGTISNRRAMSVASRLRVKFSILLHSRASRVTPAGCFLFSN